MGHKVNPYGFRLGVIYSWKSNWYAGKDYASQLHEDVWIRKHIRSRLSRAGAAYDLAQGALLGRGDQADIVLEDSFASSSHARLVPHGDVIVLEDLGSTNGTYLNDEPLRGPQPLHPGDRIRIGDSAFTFER